MSYILEALKKSQAERELGRVPTLDTAGMFEEDKAEPRRGPWVPVAVGLAGAAMLIALYAALRGPAPQPGGGAPSPGPGLGQTQASDRSALAALQIDDPLRQPSRAAQPPSFSSGPDRAEQSATPMDPAAVPPGTPLYPDRVAASLPAAPLVEPPPPKGVPRPPVTEPPYARRDAVGPETDQGYPQTQAELDAVLERELERQLTLEPDPVANPAPEPLEEAPSDPPPTPVPPDLIAEIEAFKDQVRRGSGNASAATSPAASKPAGVGKTQDPTALRLTPAQQAALPAFMMTVHVYEREQARRFVLINGLKYREGDQTREGLSVERILPDGAVLSHEGHPFYLRR